MDANDSFSAFGWRLILHTPRTLATSEPRFAIRAGVRFGFAYATLRAFGFGFIAVRLG